MFSLFSGFKWFGSLTNLRRKSDAQKDDEAIKEMSADDMGMNPRSQNYASSSEMYTHMGTMPRHPKKDKSLKKSKSKDKNTLSQSQSTRPAQDHVVDSPLLSVLQGLEVLEHPILEEKPTAGTRDNHIQNRDLPLPPTVDGHSSKLEDEHKEPVVVSKLHVDPTSAYLEPSPDLCLSKESKVQPVLPKKKHKEEDASLKVAEELQVDSNLIQLPLKMSSQMEQKTAVEEDADIESDCKQDSQEKIEPNR